MMKLNKSDYINVASSAAAAIGLILAFVGCLALSGKEGIGVNLALSPVVYIGVALIVIGLAGAIFGNLRYIKGNDMNRFAASLALYITVVALLVVIVLVAYTIFIPVLNPSNG